MLGSPVAARELAALGGATGDHVNLLARQGELRRRDDGRFTAAEARRWLSARGVPGFNDPDPGRRP